MIKTLNRSNYEDWFRSLTLYLTLMNLDMALRVDEPPKLTAKSSVEEKDYYERWKHSNRTSLMIMRYTIDESIRDSVQHCDNAKAFLDSIGKKFTKCKHIC